MRSVSTASFFVLYRTLFWPALWCLFHVLSVFNPKIRAGLLARKIRHGVKPWCAFRKGSRPIWIHCASFEFEYAKPVITQLKELRPNTLVMVTYFSPSVENAAKRFPGVDFACPLPWDRPLDLQEFIKWHEPQVLLIARTDVWPEMARQTMRSGVASLLFSATLAPTSGRAKGLGRWISRATFQYLHSIYCVSELDRAVFSGIGFADRVTVAGDTRYDQVTARLKTPTQTVKPEPFLNCPSNLLIAGSTWPEDEAVLLEAAMLLQNQSEQTKLNCKIGFVFVPHEPTLEHVRDLKMKLESRGIPAALYSQAKTWPASNGVSGALIIDQVGILAELYQKGRFAFVGGSFRKTVHSVLEPLAAGCLTFVGPKHQNNREALEFKAISAGFTDQSITCVSEVKDAAGLAQNISSALAATQTDHSAIKMEVQSRCGKSSLVADWCLQHLS